MSNTIIDRRLNSSGKSLPNRQRFLARAKQAIKKSADQQLGGRAYDDASDQTISIPTDGINEPHFRFSRSSGHYDVVVPGNLDYVVGDKIPKNSDEEESRGGGGAGGDGGEDDFEFILSYKEFIDVIFDDLELPDLVKKSEKNAIAFSNQRSGYTTTGIPSNLNIEKTAIAGIGRRLALRAPKIAEVKRLEELLKLETDSDAIQTLNDQIVLLKRRIAAVTFLDDVDLRFNNFIKHPKPQTNAVMFCLLDVSGSMGIFEKTVSKKFFLLLYLFLKKQYKKIDVVFVRHHDTASECTEEEFFGSRETGGTIVSSGYFKINEIIQARYPVDEWNIYMAQASDGDNNYLDSGIAKPILVSLVDMIQFFCYVEIRDIGRWGYNMFDGTPTAGESDLWATIEHATIRKPNVSMSMLTSEADVIPKFREIFRKVNA